MGPSSSDATILIVHEATGFSPFEVQHLKEVLQRLRKAGFTLRTDRCLIGESSCTLFGHEVGKGKISPTDAKIEAI